MALGAAWFPHGTELQEPGRLERRRRDVAVRRHELSIQYLRLADPVDPRLADEDAARVWSCFAAHRRRRYRERGLLPQLRQERREQCGREARGSAALEQRSHRCNPFAKTDRLQVLALGGSTWGVLAVSCRRSCT